jgi:hypothetical protein
VRYRNIIGYVSNNSLTCKIVVNRKLIIRKTLKCLVKIIEFNKKSKTKRNKNEHNKFMTKTMCANVG